MGHFMSLGVFTPLSVLFSQLDVNKYLRPNVGLHWYFSIEMFDHFRLFFNVVFQIHLLIYILPLMIKFKCATILLSSSISSFGWFFPFVKQERKGLRICGHEWSNIDFQVLSIDWGYQLCQHITIATLPRINCLSVKLLVLEALAPWDFVNEH
jgi:hypothetical protein